MLHARSTVFVALLAMGTVTTTMPLEAWAKKGKRSAKKKAGASGFEGRDDLVLFTPDAGSLMGRVVGPGATASQLVDLLLGRLPGGFEGQVTWERLEQSTVLAMEMHEGRRALFGLERSPTRLERMVLEDGDHAVLATASWGDWKQAEGYWIPGDVALDVPDSIGLVTLSVREIQTSPEVGAETYRVEAPDGEYKSFETLFEAL